MRMLLRVSLAALLLAATASFAMASCTIPGNGGGTVDLPPANCAYLSPDDLHVIINGLPAGTTIRLGPMHHRFFGVTTTPDPVPGGGETENFNSFLTFTLQGTGDLVGFNRPAEMMIQCVAHTDARGSGPVQSFDTEMLAMQGQLPPGDPDFDLLRITAGGNFGMPSPGHTTLVQIDGEPGKADMWAVDSFFDITYRIDFVGAPGGPLAGMSGSTTGTIRMSTGTNVVPPPVPSTNAWGQIALTLLVLGTGIAVLQRRITA